MAEITYAGYVPTSRPDYSALSNELAEKIYGVLDKRQERKQKLDEIEQANQKLLNTWMPGKNQTSNDFVIKGIDKFRKDALQWNKDLKAGKISESEYIRRNRNLEENYQMLINVMKSKDERVDTVMKRQEVDPELGYAPASSYETDYLLKRFGEDISMQNREIQTDGIGGMYIAEVDPVTGLVTEKISDPRAMANPENLVANNIHVPSRVEEITKNWKPETFWEDLGLRGERNIETVRQRPEYRYMVEKAVNSIAADGNPRAQVSVLVDNGVIDEPEYYDTEEEGNQLYQQKLEELIKLKQEAGLTGEAARPTPAELKEIEISLIKNIITPDGISMPELTEEQKQLAKDRIRNQIDISFGDKITGSPLQVPVARTGTSGGGGGGGRKTEEKDPDKYAKIVNAWNSKDQLGLQLLNNNSNFSIRVENDGIAIYDQFDALVHKAKSIDNNFMLLFFGDSPTQIAEGKRQSQRYWAQNPPAKQSNKGNETSNKGNKAKIIVPAPTKNKK